MENFEKEIYLQNLLQTNQIEKSWSNDLQNKFPNGSWKTINGAKVFVDGKDVVAGLDGFNGKIDDAFRLTSKEEQHNLKPAKSKKDLSENIDKIIKGYKDKGMAAIQALNYINERPKLGKEYITDKKIKTKAEFDKYIGSRQSRLRKGIREKNRKENEAWEKTKQEIITNKIMGQALSQSDAVDRQIEEFDYIESKLKEKFGKNARYLTGVKMNKDRQDVIDAAKKNFNSRK